MNMGFSTTKPQTRRTELAVIAALSAALALGTGNASAATAQGPDRAFRTPVYRSADAGSSSSLSSATMRRGIAKLLRGFGGSAGAWVEEVGAGKVIYKRNGDRAFPIASNTKLFTTGTALSRLGPNRTLETTVWSLGEISDGVANGGLVIVGGGDPTLTGTGVAKLAKRIAATGVKRIAGPVLYDASNFDRRLGVPHTGVSGGPYLGSLSGLSYGWGWDESGPMSNPARSATVELAKQLRNRNIVITGKVKRSPAVTPRTEQVAVLESPSLRAIAEATNAPSDNFLAEMTLKLIPDQLGGLGTTANGVRVVEHFASTHDSHVEIENGSGLSRRNRATPSAVGRFLIAMGTGPADVANAYRDSLAVAGRTGTLAFRMRGTAAEGHCSAKTGTLNGVSALSGYCRTGSAGTTVFSLLFGGHVSTDAAHLAQDRITALIARYAG